jgi:hypothetical protein
MSSRVEYAISFVSTYDGAFRLLENSQKRCIFLTFGDLKFLKCPLKDADTRENHLAHFQRGLDDMFSNN